jgi:hypothetical protein
MMDFGELRSRLAGEQDSKGWSLVRAWAEQAWEAEPERFEAEWLPYLLDQVGQWRARVCDCPGHWKRRVYEERFAPLQLVRTLYFQSAEEQQLARWLEAAARSPDLGRVEMLSLAQVHIDDALLDRLARLQLPALRALVLDGCSTDLGRLEAAPWLPQLVSLSIERTRTSPIVFDKLLGAGLGERLETLWAAKPKNVRQSLPSLGAILPRMPRLKQLNWEHHTLRAAELEALASWGGALPLVELTLGRGGVEPGVIAALGAVNMPQLRQMTWRNAALDGDAAALIAWAAQQGALTHLNLASCGIEHEALGALEQLSKLSVLVLSRNAIGDRGVEQIARVPWEQLRGLGLEGCGISRVGAQRLAGCEALAGLKRLAISGNGALDTRILDRSAHLPADLKGQYDKSYLT